MPNFGKRSRGRLETCHDDIRVVMETAIRLIDFSILEGERPKELQDLYFSQGKSKLKYPESKHNIIPSFAIDIAPYPIDWNDYKRFVLLAGVILGVAHNLDIPMRWGGCWSNDLSKYKKGSQSFNDLPHFELMPPRKY